MKKRPARRLQVLKKGPARRRQVLKKGPARRRQVMQPRLQPSLLLRKKGHARRLQVMRPKRWLQRRDLRRMLKPSLHLLNAKKAALHVAKKMAKEKALEKARRGKALKPASEKPPPARGRKREHEILENFVQCEKCLKWRPTDREWKEEEQYRCEDNQSNEPEDTEDE